MSSVGSDKEICRIERGGYAALFLPSKGMNFISLRKGEIEVIDQSTKALFEERYAGLGAMIGPHFHHRNPKVIPPVKNPSRFPHVKKILEQGGSEPFSHGIGRYAPWKVEQATGDQIKASLHGKDLWHETPLLELEGQDFAMHYLAKVTDEGLEIHLSVQSETESVIGLHTYYALHQGRGQVRGRVNAFYRDKDELKPIPSTWNYLENRELLYPMSEGCDYGFSPYPDPLHGSMDLETDTHRVRVQYWSQNEENSVQLWHPEGASFVCIEPLSAKDPRKPRLTVSQLKIRISVL